MISLISESHRQNILNVWHCLIQTFYSFIYILIHERKLLRNSRRVRIKQHSKESQAI